VSQAIRAGTSLGSWMRSALAVLLLLLATPSLAAIVYVSRTQGGAASGSFTLTPPSGTTGDVLVATIAARPSTATIGIPAGWTRVFESTNTNDVTMRMATFYKITTAASEAATTWTIGTNTGVVGGILRFSGVDGASPVNASTTNPMTYTSFSVQANGVTPSAANTMLVTSHAFTSAANGWSPPGGMTEAVDVASIATPSTAGMGMEMNYQAWATATATGARSATANSSGTDSGYGIGHTLALTPATSSCDYLYSDDFNRVSLGSDWTVTTSGGSFTPGIVSNRLRLTDNTNNVATSVHLSRFFPAAGNRVVIEFDNIAYGGSGADGVALAVSDAGVPPVAGAYGGSLGYAQRTGVNGFAGGWLGVGFDEYGNFANPTEGRSGGPGQVADSVTTRGSYTGSTPGTSGYAFHRNSGALSPGVDVTAGTGTITYVGVGTTAEANSGNVTPTLPAHQAGDLLLCAATSNDNIAHSVATSGWAQTYQLAQTADFHPRSSVWWKLATSAAETNPTVTHTGGSGIVAGCSAFRGVDATNPFDAAYAQADTTASSNVTTGALTTVTANAMMVFVGHINNNRCNLSASVTGGLTWSQSYCEDRDPPGGSNDETVALHYAPKATAGAIGPITFTQSGTDSNRGALLALRPASVAPTGHRYRVSIDHSDNAHAYVTVERDTTATGASYSTIIAAYDAKAQTGQIDLPTNFILSYTGSSGGSTNIHEIDNLRICAANPITTPTLHHVRLLHDGSGTPGIGESVTVQACADVNCITLYLGSVTIDLNVSGDQTWSSDPLTFSGGQATVTLGKPTSGSLTLGGTVTSPSGAGTTRCFNGGTETCTFTFGAVGFDAVQPGEAVGSPIYLKLANVAFSVDVLAVSGGSINTGYTGTVLVDLVNPSAVSGNCGDTNAGLTSATTYTYVAGDLGRRSFSFTYAQAAANVKVRIRTSPATSVYCSTDNFAIRPQSFGLSATLPTSPTVLAGTSFTLTASPGVIGGYIGTPALDTLLITNQAGAAINGGALAGGFAAATGGSTDATLEYHDVGTVTFGTDAVVDGNFSSQDQGKTPVHCVADSTSNTLSSNLYGCNIGSAATAAIGRFIPAYFDTLVTPACPATFAFSRQPFTVTVTAKSINGTTAQGYGASPGVANSVTLSDGNAVATGALTNTVVTSSAFTAGAGTATTPTFSFTSEPVVPTAILLRATEAGGDGVTSNVSTVTYPTHVEGTVEVRSGRFSIQNAYGSERFTLAVTPGQVQYFNGSGVWANDDNSCTTIPVPTLANGGLSFAGSGALASGAVSVWVGTGQPATTSTSSGAISSVMVGTTATTGPTPSTGYVEMIPSAIVSWPAWLPTPRVRFSFGLYNQTGNSRRIIYRREMR
jgi:hypothetical protein